jgi:hypothetical protein
MLMIRWKIQMTIVSNFNITTSIIVLSLLKKALLVSIAVVVFISTHTTTTSTHVPPSDS